MSGVRWVELVALLLAAWAGWRTLPRPPALEWERLFKVILATLIRGEVEAADGELAEWRARLRPVPYGPPGRDLLCDDPEALGEDYDPGLALGLGWDELAAGEGDAALARKLGHVVWVCPDWMAPVVRGVGLRVAPPGPLGELLDTLDDPADRLVFVLEGGAVLEAMRALHASPPLRDRVLAVVALAADLSGDRDWVDVHFRHEELDPELLRATPWFYVHDLARDHDQRVVEPPLPPSGRRSIEGVSLGALSLSELDPDLLGRALLVLLAFRMAHA